MSRCLAQVDRTHWCQMKLLKGVCSVHGPRQEFVPKAKKTSRKGRSAQGSA